MRIISQDGKIDINYDDIYITSDRKEENSMLVCSDSISNDTIMILGHFTTEEKALSVMEKIRNAYIQGNAICIIPEDE